MNDYMNKKNFYMDIDHQIFHLNFFYKIFDNQKHLYIQLIDNSHFYLVLEDHFQEFYDVLRVIVDLHLLIDDLFY